MGKSRYACKWLRELGGERSIIIAPLTVCPQWVENLEALWPDMPVVAAYGRSGASIASDLANVPRGVVVLTDSLLQPLINVLLRWHQGGALVVDESHRFAGVSTKRGRAMRRLAWSASHVRLLTGTPTPNHMGSLWGQMVAVDKDGWGTSYERFARRFLIRDSMFPSKVLGVRNETELQDLLLRSATIVRREDVFGQDQWQEVVRNVSLPPLAWKQYNQLKKDWLLDAPTVTADVTIVRVGKLQQVTAGVVKDDDGATHVLHTAKIDACLDDLEEVILSGEKAIVFYKYVAEGDLFVQMARKRFRCPVLRLGGGTKSSDREVVFDTIENGEGPAIAVVQTQAGGTGRSFAEAGYAFFLSEDFKYADHIQAHDRIYKRGHPRVVTVYRVPGTVDTTLIGKALDNKQDVHERVRTADIKEWV